jgi:biopolymer transport protein ExbD
MPPKILLRLGLAFLFVASTVYFLTGRWLHSRIFTPLDYSVSLESRQLKSPPFLINLRDEYYVSLRLDDATNWQEAQRCNDENLLGSEWRVYKLTSKAAQPRVLWADSGKVERVYELFIGTVAASSGQYELEWDLPPSAACLYQRHAQLVVYTGRTGYDIVVSFAQICCVFLMGTGAALILFAIARALKHAVGIAESPRMFPDMPLRNLLPIAKHAPFPQIHGMPNWGLFCGAVFWILTVVFMVLQQPLTAKGLFVTWRTRDAVVWEKSPWHDTLEVYLAETKGAPRFLINGQEVQRSELRAKLIEQLSRRAEWSVYFEADDDVFNMDALYAIDAIQGCGAKLIWVTPKMREQWQHASGVITKD